MRTWRAKLLEIEDYPNPIIIQKSPLASLPASYSSISEMLVSQNSITLNQRTPSPALKRHVPIPMAPSQGIASKRTKKEKEAKDLPDLFSQELRSRCLIHPLSIQSALRK